MASGDDVKSSNLQQSKIRKLRLMQAAVAEAMKQKNKQKPKEEKK